MDLFMFNFELRYYYINYYKAGIVCTQNKHNKGSQVCRTKKKNVISPIGSWICLHTAKKDQKMSNKIPIIYFSYAKVQSVLKTDQGADVSAHAFFSAHEAKKQHHTYIDTITNC